MMLWGTSEDWIENNNKMDRETKASIVNRVKKPKKVKKSQKSTFEKKVNFCDTHAHTDSRVLWLSSLEDSFSFSFFFFKYHVDDVKSGWKLIEKTLEMNFFSPTLDVCQIELNIFNSFRSFFRNQSFSQLFRVWIEIGGRRRSFAPMIEDDGLLLGRSTHHGLVVVPVEHRQGHDEDEGQGQDWNGHRLLVTSKTASNDGGRRVAVRRFFAARTVYRDRNLFCWRRCCRVLRWESQGRGKERLLHGLEQQKDILYLGQISSGILVWILRWDINHFYF